MRAGGFFPSLLGPHKRAERALVAPEASVEGVSTRRVDDLVKASGMDGIRKIQVSRLCQTLDEKVARFRARPLTVAYPSLWLDTTFGKARERGSVVSQALVAIGVTADGVGEGLGVDVGPSEDGAFGLAFLRGLLARGLSGVRLVTSDAHQALRAAIGPVLHGASWPRSRVPFVRTALAFVPKGAQAMVAATIRAAFRQPAPEAARRQ
jgi:transposase-like protein